MRGTRSAREDRVVSNSACLSRSKCFSHVQVSIIAREITAGHLHSETMPSVKHLRGGLQINFKAIHLSRIQQGWLRQRISIPGPQHSITDRHGAPIWPDIAKTHHSVRIRGGRGRIEDGLHWPDDREVMRKGSIDKGSQILPVHIASFPTPPSPCLAHLLPPPVRYTLSR